MLMKRFPLNAALACMVLMSACATSGPPSAMLSPPRRQMPETAKAPCGLPILPQRPTYADLEAGYLARGAAIVACDASRQLAVDVQAGEHQDIDAWLKIIERRR